jgi:hypothetical protein
VHEVAALSKEAEGFFGPQDRALPPCLIAPFCPAEVSSMLKTGGNRLHLLLVREPQSCSKIELVVCGSCKAREVGLEGSSADRYPTDLSKSRINAFARRTTTR